MEYRQIDRVGLKVSVIGFGTAQLRLVPKQQAIDTLLKGFSLGVNLVHTAPDYEGAEDIVAKAVKESGKNIIVCSHGYGDMAHFEWLFENTCRKFNKKNMELYGIACIDDREILGENVWGPGGQIEFLQQKKQEGRIRGIFCTTHGSKDYIRKLIDSNLFDVLIIAYNPLGFHLLSSNQEERRIKESISDNVELFKLAEQRNIGIILMKPLAGGLLCQGKAFPQYSNYTPSIIKPEAHEILRFLLHSYPQVTCVIPGTASVEEAQENALAGYTPLEIPPERSKEIQLIIKQLQSNLCHRCGVCESLCSNRLPISWLIRAAYILNYRSMTFETPNDLQYRVLHPWKEAVCIRCKKVTCNCPHGINIPQLLIKIHQDMDVWEKQR